MLLEREVELAQVAEFLREAPTGGGRVVLVRGEAGIGKSALIEQLRAQHRDDAYVLVGACDDLLTPQTLGALRDLARIEPSIADAVATDDLRRTQDLLFDLMCRSLRPTLLVLEDTQWADEATLDVIRYLGRRVGRTNGVLVITYRDVEVDLEHALRQVVGDLPPANVVRMQLRPLSAAAVAVLVGASGRDVDDVLAQTDGNPLFVNELLASGDSSVPSSIREIVVARASRLSAAARTLLDVVAVVPGGADLGLIDSIAPATPGALDEAVRAGLLRSVDRSIRFVHELQRRAIEAELRADRRRDLNRRALEAYGPNGDPGRLVHHAREAGDEASIALHAPRAARAALSAGSSRLAIEYFRTAEPFLESFPPRDAGMILYELAKQEQLRTDPEALGHIERSVDLLLAAEDPFAAARALVLSSSIKFDNLETGSALADAERAVRLLAGHETTGAYARALRALASLTWAYYEDGRRALPIVEDALETAMAAGDDVAIIDALSTKGSLEYSLGLPGGMDLVESARSRAAAIGDRVRELHALHNMSGMYADFRILGPAVDMARRAIDTAVRFEHPAWESEARAVYAEILMWLGRWDEATDSAAQALDGRPYTAAIAWRILGAIQTRRGGVGGREALDRMWKLTGSSHALSSADPAASAFAEYMWLTGDHDDEVLGQLDEVLAFGLDVGNPWPSGALAFWMWKLGRLDAPPAGSFDFYMWIVRGDVERAAAFWAGRGVRYEQALALMHGDDGQCLEALRLAEDLGADALAARIRADLAASGVAVPRGKSRSTRGHAAGLTARQAEVLDLLCERCTNADIADRLFLSPRTVENHVAAILLKLDARGREQAVDRARELGLA